MVFQFSFEFLFIFSPNMVFIDSIVNNIKGDFENLNKIPFFRLDSNHQFMKRREEKRREEKRREGREGRKEKEIKEAAVERIPREATASHKGQGPGAA